MLSYVDTFGIAANTELTFAVHQAERLDPPMGPRDKESASGTPLNLHLGVNAV